MYQYYDITLQGTDTLTLSYKLEQHRPAQVWASLMLNTTPESLRKNFDSWQLFDNTIINKKISKLEDVINSLNLWLPENEQIREVWNHNNHQESVNKFHIHFPEHEKNEKDLTRKQQLSEYNDLIHEIEELAFTLGKPRPYLLVLPDNQPLVDLEDDDYNHFKASIKFGDLLLHYCHVGRHPLELFAASDYDCPIDQIVPQHSITTYHSMRFYNSRLTEWDYKSKFAHFYKRSTLNKLYKINDKKMAFGYCTLGKLQSNLSEMELIKKLKTCDKIMDWKIY